MSPMSGYYPNRIESSEKNDRLCCCSGTTASQIRQLIEQGIDSFERISRITGACSGCGGCETEIRRLLAGSE